MDIKKPLIDKKDEHVDNLEIKDKVKNILDHQVGIDEKKRKEEIKCEKAEKSWGTKNKDPFHSSNFFSKI